MHLLFYCLTLAAILTRLGLARPPRYTSGVPNNHARPGPSECPGFGAENRCCASWKIGHDPEDCVEYETVDGVHCPEPFKHALCCEKELSLEGLIVCYYPLAEHDRDFNEHGIGTVLTMDVGPGGAASDGMYTLGFKRSLKRSLKRLFRRGSG